MTLPGPPLNISGGFFPGSIHSSFYGRDWQDPRTGEKPFRDEDRVRYVYVSRSEVYDREYISEHGKCQPSSSEVSELLKICCPPSISISPSRRRSTNKTPMYSNTRV